MQCIWKQVSQLTGLVGLEVKVMNLPKPGKYRGQDDLEKFDKWLSHLLKYYHIGKDMGMGNPHGLWVWVSMGMDMGWYQPTHEPIPITHGQPVGLFQYYYKQTNA